MNYGVESTIAVQNSAQNFNRQREELANLKIEQLRLSDMWKKKKTE